MIQATKDHCKFCFEVLIAKLITLPPPSLPPATSAITAPLFVTWSKSKDSLLRGCIGTFESYPLSSSLPQFALSSALKDPRFPPISIDEVEELKVEQQSALYQWEIGKHGIILTFRKGLRTYSGTFLPQVAAEEGWNQRQTLNYLIEKAGYKGKLESVEDPHLTTYESSKASLTYEEYRASIEEEVQQISQ